MIVHQLLCQLSEYEKFREMWKEEIVLKWEESKNYPRKKKKKVRKELLLDWRFANYDIFNVE